MILAAVVTATALAVVLWAVYADPAGPATGSGATATRPARPPVRDGLPTPSDLARPDLPLSWRGYQPAAVDAYLDTLREAYVALYRAAPPAVRDRAGGRATAPPDGRAG